MEARNGHIVKWLFAALFLGYIAYGLHRCQEEGDVVRLEFKEFNPPIYDFPFSVDSLARALVAIDKDVCAFVYGMSKQDDDSYRFRSMAGKSYIYVYRKDYDRCVQESSSFIVTLDSLSEDSTRVAVRRDKITVGYGVYLWKGPTFKNYWIRYHQVSTPYIQEYDLLRLLGKKLGYLEHMPFTKYPKELSQRQILQRLNGRRGRNTFTAAEVFGSIDSCMFTPLSPGTSDTL